MKSKQTLISKFSVVQTWLVFLTLSLTLVKLFCNPYSGLKIDKNAYSEMSEKTH